MRRRQQNRRITRVAFLATAGVLVLAGLAFRETALELWYIHLLGSDEEWRRLDAIEALGEMESRRAVPHLIEMLREDARSDEPQLHSYLYGDGEEGLEIPRALARAAPEGIQALAKLLDDPAREILRRVRRPTTPLRAGCEQGYYRPSVFRAHRQCDHPGDVRYSERISL